MVVFYSYFWGWGKVQKLFWGLLMQLNNFYFLMFSSIANFDFHFLLGSFLTFLGPYWATFGVSGRLANQPAPARTIDFGTQISLNLTYASKQDLYDCLRKTQKCIQTSTIMCRGLNLPFFLSYQSWPMGIVLQWKRAWIRPRHNKND